MSKQPISFALSVLWGLWCVVDATYLTVWRSRSVFDYAFLTVMVIGLIGSILWERRRSLRPRPH
jgi:hypothetical protein